MKKILFFLLFTLLFWVNKFTFADFNENQKQIYDKVISVINPIIQKKWDNFRIQVVNTLVKNKDKIKNIEKKEIIIELINYYGSLGRSVLFSRIISFQFKTSRSCCVEANRIIRIVRAVVGFWEISKELVENKKTSQIDRFRHLLPEALAWMSSQTKRPFIKLQIIAVTYLAEINCILIIQNGKLISIGYF